MPIQYNSLSVEPGAKLIDLSEAFFQGSDRTFSFLPLLDEGLVLEEELVVSFLLVKVAHQHLLAAVLAFIDEESYDGLRNAIVYVLLDHVEVALHQLFNQLSLLLFTAFWRVQHTDGLGDLW